ncbi:hypothetical protein OG538_31885 [Streptomyces sp. NBC_01013]|nr:hypothetical protein OG538_31885 [Streptomyces sp. NBC_01013]
MERHATPVGMDVELYRAGPKYKQEPSKLEQNRELASELALRAPWRCGNSPRRSLPTGVRGVNTKPSTHRSCPHSVHG